MAKVVNDLPGASSSLLAAGDPDPVIAANLGGVSPMVLLGDHAGRAIPTQLGRLGLSGPELDRHIAWDIGVAGLGAFLAERLDAVFIRQTYSRLVIDCNRGPGRPGSIAPISDGTAVPGNQGLTPADAVAREAAIFRPYHAHIATELDARFVAGRPTVLVSLHSFTPVMGAPRPWRFGVLHRNDSALSRAKLTTLQRREGAAIGDNQPYAMDGADFTIPHHADPRGLDYLELEVRQDLIATTGQQVEIAAMVASALTERWRRCQRGSRRLMATYDVAVVGLGAMGGAALYHLAARGQRVIGLDRFPIGHTRGSSHGESRIIRLAYCEHPDYVPLLRLAYRNWCALEAATGQALLLTTGMIEAGPPGAAIVAGTLASALEHALPHEVLSAADIGARFPALTLPAHWTGVFQPDAGILAPERIIALHVAAAKAKGAEVREGAAVAGVRDLGGSVELTLADGSIVVAGAVILAAGGWIGDLAPRLAPHLRLTRQPLVWFEPAAPALATPDRLPIFMLEDPRTVTYGFPDWAGTGIKAASHDPGRRLANADAAAQDADEADARLIAGVLADLVPAAAGPVRRMATCFYTRTPDEHFILGPSPDSPRIILASPCSGHGFKFASIIGEILADLAITGETDKPIGLFSPTRFDRT